VLEDGLRACAELLFCAGDGDGMNEFFSGEEGRAVVG
jgi:hypothetical protein